jgi:hypothetical protein
MIAAPHNFAPLIEDQKLAKIGALALRWALIEYTLGNCLKGALRLDNSEATVMCFSLGVHERISKLSELNLSKKAKAILAEFKTIMQGVQWVRNNALHSAVTVDDLGIPTFYRRSIQSHTSLDEILGAEELTNYAAHLVTALRYAIGIKGEVHDYTLPDRPPIPAFLQSKVQFPKPKKKKAH